MTIYFDTSAILKTLLVEERSDSALALWRVGPRRATSRMTYPESRAGLAFARRTGRLAADSFRKAKRQLEERFLEIDRIDLSDSLCHLAGELAERHGLRGYDSVHLASALAVADDELIFATWDSLLSRAAFAEGMTVST